LAHALEGDRLVDLDWTGNRPICELFIPRYGCQVHLKGSG